MTVSVQSSAVKLTNFTINATLPCIHSQNGYVACIESGREGTRITFRSYGFKYQVAAAGQLFHRPPATTFTGVGSRILLSS